MARPKKNPLDHHKSVIDSMIWMSYRYAIGRHTIAACMHAPELAKFIEANKAMWSPERLEFMANDIRREINDSVGAYGNIHIDFFGNGTVPDALFLLAEAVLRHCEHENIHPDFFHAEEYDWYVDLRTRNVRFERIPEGTKRTYVTNIYDLFSDLNPWIKLAGFLSPTVTVKYTDPDTQKTVSEPGFQYPVYCRYHGDEHFTLSLRTSLVDNYLQNTFVDSYINEQYVTAITPIIR